jgi:hypothetical protein
MISRTTDHDLVRPVATSDAMTRSRRPVSSAGSLRLVMPATGIDPNVGGWGNIPPPVGAFEWGEERRQAVTVVSNTKARTAWLRTTVPTRTMSTRRVLPAGRRYEGWATARCLSIYEVYWTYTTIQPSRDIGANAGPARGPDIAGHSGAPAKRELAGFARSKGDMSPLSLIRRVWRTLSPKGAFISTA